MRPTAQPVIVLVSDASDDGLREAVARLEAAGAIVECVGDVYSAMARLAQGDRFNRILVDVRTMDRHEMAFVPLTPRYFPDTVIEIPRLSGTSQAIVRLGQPELSTTEIAAIIESLSISHTDETPVMPVAQSPPARGDVLSTDGVAPSGPADPPMHEAVRRRMAAGDASPPVRRAPNRMPPGNPPSRPTAPTENQSVSPEEIEALFDPRNSADGNGGGSS